ncbi:MAG: hypothetical protein HY060_10065 [Proteobacteria bacterium]|nr:hypothetical protein [Pseudomonadota bacterium]
MSVAIWGAASAQTPPQFSDAAHLGVTTCAGSTCHGALEPFRNSNVAQNEYVLWQQKDKHSKAYKVLFEERSVRIARNLGLPNAHTAEICLNCHADNTTHRGRQFQLSDGVACEACHGGSSGWLGVHISGASHQDNLAAGLYPTDQPVARAKLCLSCHIGNQANKFVTHRIMGAGHPRMSFELDTFTAIQPAHYVVDKDYVERKGAPNGVQTWAVGQAMALAETMAAFLDARRNPDGFFPELVFYDCHACHHPMSNVRWEPRASTGLGPGVIKFNDANALMLRIIAERVDPGAGRALGERMLAFHRAMTENRANSLREAAAVREIASQLVNKFSGHGFGRDDVRALATGVINDGLNKNDFVEYAAAEQATMALSAIVSTMRNVGLLNEAQYKQAMGALNKLYDAVAKDEEYKAPTFAAALRDFNAALPATTN